MKQIHIITASAGTGKTTRLSDYLSTEIAAGAVRPDAIIATTFTKRAAAELQERARAQLLAGGLTHEAHRLMASRIGTVNSVAGSIVEDYAFELGLPPGLRTLDEDLATTVLRRALASAVDTETEQELQGLSVAMPAFDWPAQVHGIIASARANGLHPKDLAQSRSESVSSLAACLGPALQNGAKIDAAFQDALATFVAEVNTTEDTTIGTAKYLKEARSALSKLKRGVLPWSAWAKLSSASPTKKSKHLAEPIQAAAAEHARHPTLHKQMRRAIELLFEIAERAWTAYQEEKAQLGAIDFVDQEAYALELLNRPDVRAQLEDEVDLVLIDEFQDTSPIQLAIFLELADLAKRTVWVGDQKQAIYGFRGTDPGLMDSAIDHFSRAGLGADGKQTEGALETLSKSYRSRPQLVELTNEIFAPAFNACGIPEDRTRLSAGRSEGSAELGSFVEYWPLCKADGARSVDAPRCLAAGVRDLLHRGERIEDRATDEERPATAGDVAILCRTNGQCQQVADALEELGVPAVLPRQGLFDTPEGQTIISALRLWLDKHDSLAAAELARILRFADDADEWLSRVLTGPSDAFDSEPRIAALLEVRQGLAHAGVLFTLDTVVDAIGLVERCHEWGNSEARLANLEAVRAHAVAYVDACESEHTPATLVGLLSHFNGLRKEDKARSEARKDKQAVVGAHDAVTIYTWWGAKGLEWPVTILFGLESLREPTVTGVHVASEHSDFDATDPLAGRWIRYWPNPYHPASKGPVRDRFEASAEYEELLGKSRREYLRLLYVMWTRARDRLILSAKEGKLLTGILGELASIDPEAINEPETSPAQWAGREVDLAIRPFVPEEPEPAAPTPGQSYERKGPVAHPRAFIAPSSIKASGATGAPIHLGDPFEVRGKPNPRDLGNAIHSFLATDSPELDADVRESIAEGLLTRWGVRANLDPSDLIAMSDRSGDLDRRGVARRNPSPRVAPPTPPCRRLRRPRFARRLRRSPRNRGASSTTRRSTRASTNRSS